MLIRITLVGLLLLAPSLRAESPADYAAANLPKLLDLYQHLHRFPELSNMEAQTAARIAAELRTAGADVTTGVGGHGLVGIIKNGPGPTLMVRTDLDGLPVTEQTGLGFASTVKVKTSEGVESGAMHACGHDIHMTCFIALARYMAAHKDRWSGTLMLIAQPAEERGTGSLAMLKDGLYEKFARPDFGIGMHNDPTIPAGKVGLRAGAATSTSDAVDITLIGRGGHGAQPQSAIDPIIMASQLIVDLQTIISRERRATEPAVITVGSVHAGTQHNIIPNTADLQLTVRSCSDEMRKHLQEAIARKAKAVAISAGAPEPKVTVTEGTPSVINNADLTARLAQTFRRTLGDDNVLDIIPATWSEDFANYAVPTSGGGVPICFFRLGSISEGRMHSMKQPVSLHSPFYYPDAEPTILTGITAMTEAALDLLKRN
jgi:hippurate hydrolase